MNPFILAAGALVLDTLLGDPETPLHPTRLMGGLAAWIEALLRRPMDRKGKERSATWMVSRGALAWLLAVALPVLAGLAFLAAFRALGGVIAAGPGARAGEGLASAFLVYVSIAPRDLARHAIAVRKALADSGLEEGRRAVSRIVGRDTDRLDEAGVLRAGIESVAESAIDGVVAPLFWALALGPLGAVAYRAINTLDSMWGHRDGRYLYFGRVAARADDAANWLPARLGFVVACLAAGLTGLDARSALVLGWRDRRAHESPNAAWLEAAFAGALGLRLGGPAWYGGQRLEKAWLGEERRLPEGRDLTKAVVLMYATTLVFAALWAGAMAGLKSLAGL